MARFGKRWHVMGAKDAHRKKDTLTADLEEWASTLGPQRPTWSHIPVWTVCPEAAEPLAKLCFFINMLLRDSHVPGHLHEPRVLEGTRKRKS